MKKEDVVHLSWIYDRMCEIHGEHTDVDYMRKFLNIIIKIDHGIRDVGKTAPLGGLPKNPLTKKDILMQEIQVLNETLYAFGECADMKSTVLVVEKLMILVNKLVPTE